MTPERIGQRELVLTDKRCRETRADPAVRAAVAARLGATVGDGWPGDPRQTQRTHVLQDVMPLDNKQDRH